MYLSYCLSDEGQNPKVILLSSGLVRAIWLSLSMYVIISVCTCYLLIIALILKPLFIYTYTFKHQINKVYVS